MYKEPGEVVKVGGLGQGVARKVVWDERTSDAESLRWSLKTVDEG